MNNTNYESFEPEKGTPSRNGHLFQIDFLKAVMIFLVIFDHMVSWNIKENIGVALWERISIPVFLVILGFNMGLSFQRKGVSKLKELYSWSYFKEKFKRFVMPFLILYAASTFIGLFMYGFNFNSMYNTQFSPDHGFIQLFTGILPFWGPGNWFIPVIFSFILIAPLLYWVFTKNKIFALILCFLIEISMQMIVYFLIGEITSWEELYFLNVFMTNILFYLSAVGLGMWFSFGHKLTAKRNIFMWILFPISLGYLIVYQFFGFRLRIDNIPLIRGDYSLFVFPYSAFLVLLALQFLPNSSNTRISKTISLIGKSTYHILLTQILGYGMITAWWGTHYGMDIPFDPSDIIDLVVLWILFIWFGILWFKIEHQKHLTRRILYYSNFFMVFPSLLFLSFWLQGFWVPIPLIIIIIYAIAALVIHYIIKKPISTKLLAIWTGFLLINFISMILQVEILLPNQYWLTLIPIGGYFLFALIYTAVSKK